MSMSNDDIESFHYCFFFGGRKFTTELNGMIWFVIDHRFSSISHRCWLNTLILMESVNIFSGKFATLDTMHALCLPLGASISLLVMFFFFDSMQMLFAVCTASKYRIHINHFNSDVNIFEWILISILFTFQFAVIATVALAFLLLPMCQYIIRPCSDGNRISFGVCGRFNAAELFSFSLSLSIVCIWVLTGHWLLMDGKCHNLGLN